MGKRTKAQQERFNEQRRVNKSKARQALFIAEYFQTKYFELYSEAASFFNDLNGTYPEKYDLRKTNEFREWKSYVNGEILKSRKRTNPQYLAVEIVENIPQTPTEPQSPPPPQSPTESESRIGKSAITTNANRTAKSATTTNANRIQRYNAAKNSITELQITSKITAKRYYPNNPNYYRGGINRPPHTRRHSW